MKRIFSFIYLIFYTGMTFLIVMNDRMNNVSLSTLVWDISVNVCAIICMFQYIIGLKTQWIRFFWALFPVILFFYHGWSIYINQPVPLKLNVILGAMIFPSLYMCLRYGLNKKIANQRVHSIAGSARSE
jgi:hypothetical protein